MITRLSICIALLLACVANATASGVLFVRPLRSTTTYQSMLIKNYDASVSIQDHIATTHVDQTFTNTMNAQVESTMLFPLPEGAVITEMIYWFNGKRYVASIREKKEAQAAYDANLRKYMDPALLQETGDNVFKLNIAPIEPLTDVRVEITYTEILPYSSGKLTYTHLLRTTGASPQPLQRVSVRVEARTQAAWTTCTTPGFENSTANQIVIENEHLCRTTFGDEKYTATRDYRVVLTQRHDALDMGVLTYQPVPADSFGVDGFFAAWALPPDTETAMLTRNIVFVADVSSSMEGTRIQQLKLALQTFLQNLRPSDNFNIVTFSTNVQRLAPDVIPASAENIAAASAFVREQTALGLTNISSALDAALHMSYQDSTANIIVFLTDGLASWGVLDENAIIDSVVKNNPNTSVRMYPIGVGPEPSKSFLNRLATRNGGFTTYITQDDSIAVLVADHLRRISMPFMTALKLSYGALQASDILPKTLPDLTVGSRVMQFGRYLTGGLQPVTLTGKIRQKEFSLSKDVFFGDTALNNRAVARLWARFKINALLDEIATVGERKELVDAVIDLSKRFGILTKYTALYADPNDPKNPTDVADDNAEARPIETSNVQLTPNPVRDHAAIDLRLPLRTSASTLKVSLVDALGRLMMVLHDAPSYGGDVTIAWSLSDAGLASLPNGLYYVVVQLGDQIVSVPCSVIR
jgi:Ca-activated chloride channel family protein